MSKLFILKFDTCVRSDIQHLKHTEPIAFAGFVQTMFDTVYVFGDPENKHATLNELVHNKVHIINSIHAWQDMLKCAKSDDCAIFWQGSKAALEHCSEFQQDVLWNAFKAWCLSNVRKFTLTTDLRFDFDKECTLTKRLHNYKEYLESQKDNITHLCQHKNLKYAWLDESQCVFVPLQIIAAVNALKLQCIKEPRLLKRQATMQNAIEAHVCSFADIKQQYACCASCAGFTYLDEYRRSVIERYIMQAYNTCLITSYLDDTILQAIKSAAQNFTLKYKVPYDMMTYVMSQSMCNLVVGDSLYVQACLLPNRWVEGVLANCSNVIVDYELSALFADIMSEDEYLQFATLSSTTTERQQYTISSNCKQLQQKALATMIAQCYTILEQTFKS
jgi:hypothetical protein